MLPCRLPRAWLTRFATCRTLWGRNAVFARRGAENPREAGRGHAASCCAWNYVCRLMARASFATAATRRSCLLRWSMWSRGATDARFCFTSGVSFFGRCTRGEAADQSPRGKRADRPIRWTGWSRRPLESDWTTCELRKVNAADRTDFTVHRVLDARVTELVAAGTNLGSL